MYIELFNGKLKLGDVVLVGNSVYGKVRRLTDDKGVNIKETMNEEEGDGEGEG